MGDEPGVFSDDELEVPDAMNPPPPIKTYQRKPRVVIPKIPAVTRLQNSEARDTRGRSRSPTPVNLHMNGNGTPPSPPSTNGNGGGQYSTNGNETCYSNHQTTNGTSSRLFSLVPAPPPTPGSWGQGQTDRRIPLTLAGLSKFVLPGTIALILAFLYALVGLTSDLGAFRSELRETMNNYQMHLINLQNLHKLEAQEGKEREKRLIASYGRLEALLLEVTRALRPNLLQGVIPTSPESFLPSPKEKKERLLAMLEESKAEFPNQPRETFVQLLATIGDTLTGQESRPAGVIILIPPNLHSTGFPSCFARKLAKGINRIFTGPSHQVNPQELTLADLLETPDLGTIHAELKSYFTYEGGKSVFVHNLEEIQSYEMLMLLHAFTDNVMAYETEATFIFTVRVPAEVYNKYSNWVGEKGYRMTYDTLTAAWSNVLTPDKTPALISRIAMANIILREGDNC